MIPDTILHIFGGLSTTTGSKSTWPGDSSILAPVVGVPQISWRPPSVSQKPQCHPIVDIPSIDVPENSLLSPGYSKRVMEPVVYTPSCDAADSVSSTCSFRGKVLKLATEKEGSRLIQRALSNITSVSNDLVEAIIEEIIQSLPSVMCDIYGNYMCQELFRQTTSSQRCVLFQSLRSSFLLVARDKRGTHSLQSLISMMVSEGELVVVTRMLKGRVCDYALDSNATHVIQQIIQSGHSLEDDESNEIVDCREESSSSQLLLFIYEEVAENLKRLATDQYGLGLVKKCIASGKFQSIFLAKIEQNLGLFVEDPFANYAVQHAIESWKKEIDGNRRRILERLIPKMTGMATHKFASNVAETAISCADPETRTVLISCFTQFRSSQHEYQVYSSLMKSPYAVFVFSTAIKYAGIDWQMERLRSLALKYMNKVGAEVRNRPKWERLLLSSSSLAAPSISCHHHHNSTSSLSCDLSSSLLLL